MCTMTFSLSSSTVPLCCYLLASATFYYFQCFFRLYQQLPLHSIFESLSFNALCMKFYSAFVSTFFSIFHLFLLCFFVRFFYISLSLFKILGFPFFLFSFYKKINVHPLYVLHAHKHIKHFLCFSFRCRYYLANMSFVINFACDIISRRSSYCT